MSGRQHRFRMSADASPQNQLHEWTYARFGEVCSLCGVARASGEATSCPVKAQRGVPQEAQRIPTPEKSEPAPASALEVLPKKVINIDLPEGEKCACENWLDHWMHVGGRTVPTFCPVAGCMNKLEFGSTVRKENSSDSEGYVVPLCKEHAAQRGVALTISDKISLVLAKKNAVLPKKGARSAQILSR